MSNPEPWIRGLLQSWRSDAARSSALSTLAKVLTVFGTTLLVAVSLKTDVWLLVTLSVFFGVVAATFLGLYVFFAIRSPDQLPSERYSLRRLEIEKGLYGDDRTGLLQPPAPFTVIEDQSRTPQFEQTPSRSLPPVASGEAIADDDDEESSNVD
jgi:hypothetical protein